METTNIAIKETKDVNKNNKSNIYNVSVPEKNVSSTLASYEQSEAVYIIFFAILLVIFILGLVQNVAIIFVFMKERCLRKVHNVFIVSLSLSDVGICVLGVWMVVVSSIYKSWIFGYSGCVYYGFTTTLLGITQISLLATISVDRYLVISKPLFLKPLRMRTAVAVVCCCYGYGLFWASLPAIGWSSYQLEGIKLRCAINWRSQRPSDLSYAMSLMVMAWLLPLTAIVYCCSGICILIRRQAKHPIRKTSRSMKKDAREKRVAVTVILMIVAFLLSWTPYSIATLIVIFGNPDDIPPSVAMIPALCAKSSIVWNPIIYVARHREYRNACLRQIPCLTVLMKMLCCSQSAESKIELYTGGLMDSDQRSGGCRSSDATTASPSLSRTEGIRYSVRETHNILVRIVGRGVSIPKPGELGGITCDYQRIRSKTSNKVIDVPDKSLNDNRTNITSVGDVTNDVIVTIFTAQHTEEMTTEL